MGARRSELRKGEEPNRFFRCVIRTTGAYFACRREETEDADVTSVESCYSQVWGSKRRLCMSDGTRRVAAAMINLNSDTLTHLTASFSLSRCPQVNERRLISGSSFRRHRGISAPPHLVEV